MKRLTVALSLAGLMVAALMLPTGTGGAKERIVTVGVGSTDKLVDDGQAVRVKDMVTCELVDPVLESLLFVQQEGTSGEGFLRSVGCDGRTRVHME